MERQEVLERIHKTTESCRKAVVVSRALMEQSHRLVTESQTAITNSAHLGHDRDR